MIKSPNPLNPVIHRVVSWRDKIPVQIDCSFETQEAVTIFIRKKNGYGAYALGNDGVTLVTLDSSPLDWQTQHRAEL